jgi:outer membrane protein OmpA-like peptidoglycan-associated protein
MNTIIRFLFLVFLALFLNFQFNCFLIITHAEEFLQEFNADDNDIHDENKKAQILNTTILTPVSIILFRNSLVIYKPSYDELRKAVDYFNNNQQQCVEIFGYSDSSGPSDLNQKLSRKRATLIKEHLISKGIQREKIIIIPLGERYPVASNKTRKGRLKNRRVEIYAAPCNEVTAKSMKPSALNNDIQHQVNENNNSDVDSIYIFSKNEVGDENDFSNSEFEKKEDTVVANSEFVMAEEDTEFSDSDFEIDEEMWEEKYGAHGALNGHFDFISTYNYSHEKQIAHKGFSKIKAQLFLELDLRISKSWQFKFSGKGFYDFAFLHQGRESYPKQMLDLYEKDIELFECFVQKSIFSNVDIKIGRQIMVWGKSDNIRVTDVLNPLDNTELGMIDIVDLRLPVTMSRFDFFIGNNSISYIMIHENRFNKNPAFGSDFFKGKAPLPPNDYIQLRLKNQEQAISINSTFNEWDLSLYSAALYDDQPYIEEAPKGLKQKNSRIGVAGFALSRVMNNWLLKTEAAYINGIKYTGLPEKKSRTDILIGFDYSGFHEMNLTLEAVNRYIIKYDKALKESPSYYLKENDFQAVFRISHDFMHDRLKLNVLASVFGITGENGSYQKFQLKYEWTDNLYITAGCINYSNGYNKIFRNIGKNDRCFFYIKYNL